MTTAKAAPAATTAAPAPGSPVLDPLTGRPCLDVKTSRQYIHGPDGKPMLAPIVVPGPAERVSRLEDALVALADFVCEHQRGRFIRSLGGAIGGVGPKVLAFLEVIEAERESERK